MISSKIENKSYKFYNKFYTTIDLNMGFWNVLLAEETKNAEFQHKIDSAFGHLASSGILTYIDDIVIYTNDFKRMFFMGRRSIKMLP